MKRWIMVVDTAPRSGKKKFLLCKVDDAESSRCDLTKQQPRIYEVNAVSAYEKDCLARVDELNAMHERRQC